MHVPCELGYGSPTLLMRSAVVDGVNRDRWDGAVEAEGFV